MKDFYGKSPLVAFVEQISRQNELADLKKLLSNNIATTQPQNPHRKNINNYKAPILSVEEDIKWLSFSETDAKQICNAFGVPYDLLIRI